ncbi:MAG: hypothetical protein AAF585_18685 [Verrucomicrobiota bacterium]
MRKFAASLFANCSEIMGYQMMAPDEFREKLGRWLTEPGSTIEPFEPSPEAYESLLNQTEESEKLSRALFASGILAFGDLSAVKSILEYDPGIPANTATGYMVAVPSMAITIMLPLPDALRTTYRTVIDRIQFIEWFEQYERSLILDENTEKFVLKTGRKTVNG